MQLNDENGDSQNNELINEMQKAIKQGKKKSKVRLVVIVALVIMAIISSPFVAGFVANKYTDKKLTALLDTFKGACYVIYEKSEYNIWTRHLKVTNSSVICGEEEAARFGILDFPRIVSGKPLPANLAVDFYDGTINADAKIFGSYGKAAKELGYGPVAVSGSLVFTLGPVSKNFRLEKFVLKAHGFGDLAAEFKVANVNSPFVSGAVKQIFMKNYSGMWISFYDNGFTQKIISMYANTIKSDNNMAKARILHGIERRISNKYKENPPVREQLVQIYRFIEKPAFMVFRSDNATAASIESTLNVMNYKGWRTLLTSLEHFPLKLYAN